MPSLRWAACGLFSLVLIAFYGGLVLHGLPGGHEAPAQELWAETVSRAWSFQELWPRWVDEAAEGQGSPALLFVPPAVSFAGALLIQLGLSSQTALGLIAGLIVLLGAVGGALLLRDADAVDQSPLGALGAPVLMLASPYLAYALLIRCDLPEMLALALYPWLLRALQSCARGRSRVAQPSLILGLMLLADPRLAALTAPFSLAWIIWLQPSVANRRRFFAILVIGLGLAAGHLLPRLSEGSSVSGFPAAERGPDYRIQQAVRFPDRRRPPLARRRDRIALVTLALTLGVAIACLLAAPSERRCRARLFGLGALGFLALSSSCSEPLYELLPWLDALHFPWRHLGPAWLCALFAAASLADEASLSRRRRVICLALPALAGALLSPSIAIKAHWGEPDPETRTFLRRADDVAVEFNPLGSVPTERWPESALWLRAEGVEARLSRWQPGLREIHLDPQSSDTGELTLSIRCRSAPGWIASWRDHPIPLSRGPFLNLRFRAQSAGLLRFRYQGPASAAEGSALSLLALLFLGLVSWLDRRSGDREIGSVDTASPPLGSLRT